MKSKIQYFWWNWYSAQWLCYSGFHSTMQVERPGQTNCLLRPSEKFTVVSWSCYWTCVLIKCTFFHVVFIDIWVNWLVDLSDTSIWCNHLICTLNWNFIWLCKFFLSVSQRQTTCINNTLEIFTVICNWTYVLIWCFFHVVTSDICCSSQLNCSSDCVKSLLDTNVPFAWSSEIGCMVAWFFQC